MIALLIVMGGISSAEPTAVDLTRWRSWKAIDAAIAVDPLDGPEELSEKADIIADRLDALRRESLRVQNKCTEIKKALSGVLQQADALRDLAGVRTRRDILLRQRQQALRVRQRALEASIRVCGVALTELNDALMSTTKRHIEYVDHARRIHEEETKRP